VTGALLRLLFLVDDRGDYRPDPFSLS